MPQTLATLQSCRLRFSSRRKQSVQKCLGISFALSCHRVNHQPVANQEGPGGNARGLRFLGSRMSMSRQAWSVAVVGATGAVGTEIVGCLDRSPLVLKSLRLLASERSAGRRRLTY